MLIVVALAIAVGSPATRRSCVDSVARPTGTKEDG
jgi:hypothetical protein